MPIHERPIASEMRYWNREESGQTLFDARVPYDCSAVVMYTHEGQAVDVSLAMAHESDSAKAAKQMVSFYHEIVKEMTAKGVKLLTWRHKNRSILRDLITGTVQCEGDQCKQKCDFCE